MALWAACWPVLVVMLAIGAAVAVIVLVAKAIDNAVVTTAELEEELEGLVSELNDLEDQLESLNSELETTQERIAELTAMETLSLTEQDELETLRARNAELERQIELTKNLAEAKQGEVTETANDLIAKAWNKQADFKKNKDGELEAVDKDSKANIDTDDYLESTLKSLEIDDDRLAFRNLTSDCDLSGDNIYQSPIWVRPYSLSGDYVKGFKQIVGHTPVPFKDIWHFEETIYLNDRLGINQYMKVENDKVSLLNI